MPEIGRRQLLGTVGAAAAGAAFVPPGAAVAAPATARTRPAGEESRGGRRRRRPNVVVVLADDMGWTDIGPFGGADIDTPHLDALARRGVRMTNFHVSPYCAPTRAMLLTGSDNHDVGLGNMIELITDEQRGRPGYEGYFNERAVTVAQRLKSAGYRTFMSGKWHLGTEDEHSPARWGFDRSYAMLRGEANHYPYQGAPSPDGVDLYREDGRLVDPPTDFYSTDLFTDRFLEYLDEIPSRRPFFGYLAYTAPHSPLQAPAEVIAKYRGVYDDGPAALARRRLARAVELGVVEPDTVPHETVAMLDWESLPAGERRAWSRRMEIYAAMIDHMDQAIGRVVDRLRDTGRLQNTYIVFLSDNGAAGGTRETNPKWGPWIRANFDNSLDNMGSGTSYVSTGPGWAQASMAPFALFKAFTTEGGTRSPAIFAGPSLPSAALSGAYGDVRDIVPSILEVTGTGAVQDDEAAPLRGRSLVPVLRSPDAAFDGPDEPAVMEMIGGRAVWHDDWKALLVTSKASGLPVDQVATRRWQLYNLLEDPGENADLAARFPRTLSRLVADYDAWAEEVGAVGLAGMLDVRPGAP